MLLLHLTGALSYYKYFGVNGANFPFLFGSAGVEFFFVLSGFIITYVHWSDFGRPSELTTYSRKRLVRIYPTFWIIFGGVYVLTLMTMGPSFRLDFPTLLRTLSLLPQSSSDQVIGTQAPILGVAWSLQYEVVFYAVMAVFVLSRSAGAVIVSVILGNLLACRIHLWTAPYWTQTTFVLLFGLGAAAAWLCRTSVPITRPWLLAVAGAATFLGFGILNDVTGQRWTLGYGVASAVMIVGLVTAEKAGTLTLRNNFFVRLGDASYALYLIHSPLVVALSKIAVRFGLHGLMGAIIAGPIIGALCVGAAIGFYRIVERPLLKALSPKPKLPALVRV